LEGFLIEVEHGAGAERDVALILKVVADPVIGNQLLLGHVDGLRLDAGSVLNPLSHSGWELGHEELANGIFQDFRAVFHDAFGDDDVDDLPRIVMRSGLSVHSSVFPGWPFWPPGLRVVVVLLGLAPRRRPGSFDGAIPLLELLSPSFSIIKVMIMTSNSIMLRTVGESDESSASTRWARASVAVTSILPMLTGTPVNDGSACRADIPALV